MSFLPRVVARNWRLKLAALGLAVFLWAVARVESDGADVRTLTDVPVLVEVGDLAWTTAGPPRPATVDVRVGGTFGAFTSPLDGRAIVRVPVDAVGSRDTVVELRRDWVVTSGESSLQVQDISPPRVRIGFEETDEEAVPISLRTTGELPDGLALAQPLAVNPPVVRVRGRKSRVDQLDSIALRPLDLSRLDESGPLRLDLDTAGLSDLSFRSTEATVEVRLEEAVERVFSDVEIGLDSLPAGGDSALFAIRPAAVDVTLRGGRTRVDRVEREELEVVVPYRVLEALRAGEQRVVPIAFRGVPELVTATSPVDSVRLVRLDAGEPPPTGAPDPVGDAGGRR